MFKIFTIVLSCLLAFNSFGQMKDLSFKFNHTAEGVPLELNKTIFTIHNGKKVKLTRAEFYLSGISLFTTDQDSFNVADAYVLVNANNPDKVHTVGSFPADHGFKKLKMDVGIDKAKNHADPTLYSASHPLGPKSPEMHWGWASGYRFIALEGLVDNNGDGTPEQEFQIHSLGDALLFRTLLDMTASHHVETEPLIINLDYTKLFNSIAMSGNLIQHGSAALNKSLLKNAATSGFLNPLLISSTENIPFESIAKFSQNNREINVAFANQNSQKIISIYTLSGQILMNKTTSASTFNTMLSDVSSGIYIIAIIDGNKLIKKQFFVH